MQSCSSLKMAQYRHVMRTDESVTAPGELWPQRYTVNGRSIHKPFWKLWGTRAIKTETCYMLSVSVTSRQTDIYCWLWRISKTARSAEVLSMKSGMQRREVYQIQFLF